jgi:hypothetical protein
MRICTTFSITLDRKEREDAPEHGSAKHTFEQIVGHGEVAGERTTAIPQMRVPSIR